MLINSEYQPGTARRQVSTIGGFRIYDIKDKANPKLDHVHARPTARACTASTSTRTTPTSRPRWRAIVGNILVIYDIRNPSKPTEVGRWWMAEPARRRRRDAASERHASIGCITPCAAATRCTPAAGCPASRSSMSATSASRDARHATNTTRRTPSRPIPSSACRIRDRRQAHRGLDRGGARPPRPRRRQAARAVPHLGRHRSDQAEDPVHL